MPFILIWSHPVLQDTVSFVTRKRWLPYIWPVEADVSPLALMNSARLDLNILSASHFVYMDNSIHHLGSFEAGLEGGWVHFIILLPGSVPSGVTASDSTAINVLISGVAPDFNGPLCIIRKCLRPCQFGFLRQTWCCLFAWLDVNPDHEST
jgi:hypothetical protein